MPLFVPSWKIQAAPASKAMSHPRLSPPEFRASPAGNGPGPSVHCRHKSDDGRRIAPGGTDPGTAPASGSARHREYCENDQRRSDSPEKRCPEARRSQPRTASTNPAEASSYVTRKASAPGLYDTAGYQPRWRRRFRCPQPRPSRLTVARRCWKAIDHQVTLAHRAPGHLRGLRRSSRCGNCFLQGPSGNEPAAPDVSICPGRR